MNVNRRYLMFGVAGVLLTRVAPVFASGTQTIGGPAFGSWWRAVLPLSVNREEIQVEIERVIEAVDTTMSPFRTLSELSQLNAFTGNSWRPVSESTCTVIGEGLRISQLTDGAFDPTVGPIVNKFGFGPVKGAAGVGRKAIILKGHKLRKTTAGATLDLCGIAKGYALDQMAGVIEATGIRSFLLEAGGEVLARGRHPNGRAWQVAIETPNTVLPTIQRIVSLKRMALATSGDGSNGGSVAGLSFNHIIDPKSQAPVVNDVASVSVLAESAMTADALATALVVMGPERGLEFANQEGIAAFFQIRQGPGISEIMTEQFNRFIIA